MVDEFGIVSRNAEMRERYGDRRGHGKARADLALPAVVVVPSRRQVSVKPPFIVPAVITDALMRRADALAAGSADLKARMEAAMATATEMEEMLAKMTGAPPPTIPADKILEAVCATFGETRSDLISPQRRQKLCWARHAFWRLARRHTRMSLPALGRWLNKDHTSVMSGLRRAEKLIATNLDWRAKYDAAEILATAKN